MRAGSGQPVRPPRRDGSTSFSTATGSSPTGRRSVPTTGSASRRRSLSPRTRKSLTARSSCSSPCPRSRVSTGRRTSTRRSSRATPPQSGRDERPGHHHRLRRQLAHVHAPPARPRGGPGGSRRAGGRRVGRARRSLGRRHRPRTCQRDQGARPCSQRGVPRGTVPPRAPRRRRESQRPPPRSARRDRTLARRGRDVSRRCGARAPLGSRAVRRLRRCAVGCGDRLESSRGGRRIHDVSRARPAHDDSERGRRHEPESRRHGRDEHEPQRRGHRGAACSRSPR